MSYCRFSQTSEVYMYEDVDYGITCCYCAFERTVRLDTPDKALMHLVKHRLAGHKVPQHAIDQLLKEIE